MAARSIASLSLSFGLVSIPVKLYSATESSVAIRFKLMAPSGARLRQQYVAETAPLGIKHEAHLADDEAPERERPVPRSIGPVPKVIDFPPPRQTAIAPPFESRANTDELVIERSTMLKGYEYEKGKFVLFTPEELKTLEAGSRKTIDIVSFVPESVVDPIYYDKAYFLAPDKLGSRPYNLLLRAMQETQRCALARWAFRSKEYVAQIRAAEGGIVLQQLFYADEVRSLTDLRIELTEPADAELELAKQLIGQISADSYDPKQFVDGERQRILNAVAEKVAGKQMAAPIVMTDSGGKVVDLLQALRASLQGVHGNGSGQAKGLKPSTQARKPAKRAPARSVESAPVPARSRSSKR